MKTPMQRLINTMAFAVCAIVMLALFLLRPADVRAQWTAPDASQNINSTNTGKVGIGTTAPVSKLEVNGDISATNVHTSKRVFRDATSNSGAPAIWYKIATLPATANETGDLLDLRITGGRYDSINKFEMNVKMGNRNGFTSQIYSAFGQISERAYSRVVAYHNGGLVDVYLYLPGNSGFASYSSIGVDMTATGWGLRPTLYPTSAGVTTLPTGTQVFDSSTASIQLAVSNTGNVGIGMTSPTTKLDVAGQIRSSIDGFKFPDGTVQTTASTGSGSSGWTNGGPNVNLTNTAAKVGIGTSSPLFKLDVQGGQLNASGGLCIAGDCRTSWSQGGGGSSGWNDGGASVNLTNLSANVGIGTLTPGYKLHVAGTAGLGQAYLTNSDLYFTNPAHNHTAIGNTAGHAAIENAASHNTLMILGRAGGIGNVRSVSIWDRLDVNGDLNTTGTITGETINAKYQDVAEWVPSTQDLSAGTVVVLDHERSNHVIASSQTYDTRVAGVVSAQPGVLLGQGGAGKLMVATTGRVRVKVDASHAPIKVGDLLVTGAGDGLAMKSMPIDLAGTPIHRPGTIIGKALEPLEKGSGEILVLLGLQ